MRIMLCYPPLLPTNDAAALAARDDKDNSVIPIGVYILGAILRDKGHEVLIENFALMPWDMALARVKAVGPKLFGITCYTFHRHYVARFTAQVRRLCPTTHISVGGVHASAMPLKLLDRWTWIDTVAVGESEVSWPILVARLAAGEGLQGLLGIASRDDEGVPIFPGRQPAIEDLDLLPIAARYWSYDILATSRGCPFACNFCSSPSIWGRKVRERSPRHVISELEHLRRAGITQVHFKDETFTLKRSRVVALCQSIIDARLGIWWTCDTRASSLDEERLYMLRKAGCFHISLGVETGSPQLIDYYNKREKREAVIAATRLARRFGITVRHYYIIGAEAETDETVGHTLDLIEQSRPQRLFVSTLSVLPGTELHDEMCQERGWDDSIWFDNTDEWIPADPTRRWRDYPTWPQLNALINGGKNPKDKEILWPLTQDELRLAVQVAPDAWASRYDLSQSLMKQGCHQEALTSINALLELNPGFDKAWLDAAHCLRAMNLDEDALTALERVAQLEYAAKGNKLLALLERAVILFDQNHPDLATQLCLEIVRTEPRVSEAYRLATTRLLAAGRAAPAAAFGALWIRAFPNDALAWATRARCAAQQGRLDESRVYFERAIELAPDESGLTAELAVILNSLGGV